MPQTFSPMGGKRDLVVPIRLVVVRGKRDQKGGRNYSEFHNQFDGILPGKIVVVIKCMVMRQLVPADESKLFLTLFSSSRLYDS